MIIINNFIQKFSATFVDQTNLQPWEITNDLTIILNNFILNLDKDYNVTNGIAIHKSAIVESGAVLKAPVIISENCYIAANAYLRGAIYLDKCVKIGPSSEIKQSIIFENTSVAHFNYIGNSIIGSNVNFEAGSISANHFNERTDKKISVVYNDEILKTNSEKFGSLVGDNSKIGANAVLSPGTLLNRNTIVKRLELIDQLDGKPGET